MVTLYLPLILLSFLFCSPENSKVKPEITLAFASDPVTIDPVFATDLASQKLGRFLFKTLFTLDKNGLPEPWLAEGYQWYPLSRQLVVRLKPEVSAEDVSFSLQRLMTENGPRKSSASLIQSVTVSGQNEVTFRIGTGLYNALVFFSMPQTAVYSKTEFRKGNFTGWGDFRLTEWNRNNYILLESDKPGLPKRLMVRILPNASSSLFLFSRDQLDIMPLPFFLLSSNRIRQGRIVSIRGQSVQYVAINHTDRCFDLNFRKALNYAVNRKLVTAKLFDSYAEDVDGALPANNYPHEYDPDKAKKHLAASICYPAILDRTLDFRMRGDDINQAVGKSVAGYLKRIGLKVKLNPMEKVMIYRENSERKGDLTLLSWYLDYSSPLNFIDPVFNSKRPGNGGNRSFYHNPEVDGFIAFAQTADAAQINSRIGHINHIIREDAPWIFLWSIFDNYLVSKKAERYPALLEYLKF